MMQHMDDVIRVIIRLMISDNCVEIRQNISPYAEINSCSYLKNEQDEQKISENSAVYI